MARLSASLVNLARANREKLLCEPFDVFSLRNEATWLRNQDYPGVQIVATLALNAVDEIVRLQTGIAQLKQFERERWENAVKVFGPGIIPHQS